jgi:hypothetical protein
MKHNPWITADTRQPTPEERLSNFKAQAAYHPELVNMIGNQFFKQFNQAQGGQ